MPIQELEVIATDTFAICDNCGDRKVIRHTDHWVINDNEVMCPKCRLVWTCEYCSKTGVKSNFNVDWRGCYCSEDHAQKHYLAKGRVFVIINGVSIKHHDYGEISIEGNDTLFFNDDDGSGHEKMVDFFKGLAKLNKFDIQIIEDSE